MKKYYDKVLFLLALALLGIGAAVFYYKAPSGGLPKVKPLPPINLSGGPYAPIDKPTFTPASHSWDTPPDQDADGDGWLYYVFTPPKIWWDPDAKTWIVNPPRPPEPPPPFGLKLVSAKKDIYRIQLQGTSGKGDKEDAINFSDEEPGNQDFRLYAPGATLNDVQREANEKTSKLHEIEIKDLTFETVDKGHGVVYKAAKVTILDTRDNKTVTLTQGEVYTPTNNQIYTLETTDPFPAKEWTIAKTSHDAGKDEPLSFPGSLQNMKDEITFKVVALDFDKPSVTVEKRYIKGSKAKSQQEELTIGGTPSSEQTKSSTTPASKTTPGSTSTPKTSTAQ